MIVFHHVQALAVILLITCCRGQVLQNGHSDDTPNPSLKSKDFYTEKRNFVSATLGSNMVLQRDKPAIIWGFSKPGATITTVLRKGNAAPYPALTTTVKEDTIWRQELPTQNASKIPYSIQITSNSGESALLDNVLFGDVYLCGGQVSQD